MATRRTKSEMAGNIRGTISNSPVDTEKEAAGNMATATTIATIAVTLDKMNESTENVFLDILDSLREIPTSLKGVEKQNSDVMKKISSAIVHLDEELKKTNDPKKQKELIEAIEGLKIEGEAAFGKSTEGKLPSGPTSFKELIPAMFGVTQQSKKEAGGSSLKAAKTAIGASFKGAFGIGTVDPAAPTSFEDVLKTDRAQVEQAKKQAEQSKNVEGAIGNARGAKIAARDKETPAHLKIETDEEGNKYRTSKAGKRVSEKTASGAINPAFSPKSGMFGATLIDGKTGATLGTPGAAAGTQAKFTSSGSDAKTDSSSEDLLAKLGEVDENTDELEDKASGGIASLLMGLIPAMIAGIAPLMAMLLPALGAIAMPLLGIVAAVLAVVAIVKLFKFFQKKGEEKKLAAAQLDEKITDMRAAGKSEKEIRDALKKENPELAPKLLEAGMKKTEDSKKKVAQLDDTVTKLRSEGKSDREIRKVLAKDNPNALAEVTIALDKKEKEKTAAKEATGAPATTAPATTAPATTGRATTAPATTGRATTAPATTGRATTAPATTPAVATIELAPNPKAAVESYTSPAAALSIASISATNSASGRVPAQAAIEQQSALSSAASAAPTIINNSTDNSVKSSSSGGGQSSGGATITLRDVHNSYIRFQEKRMARVM